MTHGRSLGQRSNWRHGQRLDAGFVLAVKQTVVEEDNDEHEDQKDEDANAEEDEN